MDKQLFLFPEIDYEATKEKVEEVLAKAKILKKIASVRPDERLDRIQRALDCLDHEQRQIIERCYFNEDYDYLIYTDLNLGSTKYYEVKKEAICILAAALRLEVFKETLEAV